MDDTAEATIREYYEALRTGEPIHPFFADSGPVVKVGIGERMVGADVVAEGLAEQTRTTAGWEVESRDLHVGVVEGRPGGGARPGPEDAADRDLDFAWFGDEVFMGWTDTERNVRFEFDTRWSGALVRRLDQGGDGPGWRFVEMHVSTPGET